MIGLTPAAYWRRRLGNALARRFLSYGQQARRSLRNIRGDLAAFGFPVDDMSDDELADGMRRIGETVRQLGVSTEQAAQACGALGAAWPEEMREGGMQR